MNDADQAVVMWTEWGQGFFTDLDEPFVGRLQDLTTDRSWAFGSVLAINNKGTIAARATRRTDGLNALVLLIPSGQ